MNCRNCESGGHPDWCELRCRIDRAANELKTALTPRFDAETAALLADFHGPQCAPFSHIERLPEDDGSDDMP